MLHDYFCNFLAHQFFLRDFAFGEEFPYFRAAEVDAVFFAVGAAFLVGDCAAFLAVEEGFEEEIGGKFEPRSRETPPKPQGLGGI